ncbi:hypothetical protein JCM11641_007821 [Rhodosporidiobolus odoratus]
MSTRPTSRKPLQPLPLEPFTHLNSPSSSSSPKKRLQARDRMALLPSPFPSTSSRSPVGPLATLYEAPRLHLSPPQRERVVHPSPRSMLDRDEQETVADDEMPHSSPRRLLDSFLKADPRSSPSLVASPAKSSRASLPPPSPRRTMSPFVSRADEQQQEDATPAWSFYQDDGDEPSSASTSAGQDAPMSPGEDDTTPTDKENNRPPPRRRRSTSLLSQTSTATLAAPSPTVASTSTSTSTSAVNPSNSSPARPPPLAFLPPPSAAMMVEHSILSPRTPLGASTPSFPSLFDATTTNPVNAFAESAATSFSPGVAASEETNLGAGLLPDYATARGAAGGGRKRPSLDQADGPDKRLKKADDV